MFPWLVFLKKAGKRLSDIEYLAVQEFNGNLTVADGIKAAGTGDVVSITAGSGDMYLAFAQINFFQSTEAVNRNLTVVLKVNTVITATLKVNAAEISSSSGSGMGNWQYKFPVGFKVTTGQVIKIEITENESNDWDVNGELQCIEVTTGVSPAV